MGRREYIAAWPEFLQATGHAHMCGKVHRLVLHFGGETRGENIETVRASGA
jgi:hypothetical protein